MSSFGLEHIEDALDSYSRVVTTVADRLIPSVASLRVTHKEVRINP